jgi:hypothetical protein
MQRQWPPWPPRQKTGPLQCAVGCNSAASSTYLHTQVDVSTLQPRLHSSSSSLGVIQGDCAAARPYSQPPRAWINGIYAHRRAQRCQLLRIHAFYSLITLQRIFVQAVAAQRPPTANVLCAPQALRWRSRGRSRQTTMIKKMMTLYLLDPRVVTMAWAATPVLLLLVKALTLAACITAASTIAAAANWWHLAVVKYTRAGTAIMQPRTTGSRCAALGDCTSHCSPQLVLPTNQVAFPMPAT